MEEERLKAVREGRKEKRTAKVSNSDSKEAAAEAFAAGFELCREKCVCDQDPCPYKGFEKCGTCGAIKRHKCKVRKCVEARKPLLLTYVESEAGPETEVETEPESDVAN